MADDELQRKYDFFLCGTRKVERKGPRDWRVVCATCGEGGVLTYPHRSAACDACVNQSTRKCNACGAS